MVELLQVQVKDPGIACTDRERKLIQCLVMRVCVHHLYRHFAKAFRIRTARVDSIYLLVNHHVYVEGGITHPEAMSVMDNLEKDIRTTLQMCEVSADEILLTAKV